MMTSILIFLSLIILLLIYLFLKKYYSKGKRKKSKLIVSSLPSREQALIVPESGPQGPVRAEEFSIVGVFDVDWLTDTRFLRLLDNMSSSPGAFKTVRFFGALSSGEKENTKPSSSGIVWPDVNDPIDFSRTFDALDALTSRGLIPFVNLSFFPSAVSDSPILPPPDYSNWKTLIKEFFTQLHADDRFKDQDNPRPIDIKNWWFEVWNEPNVPIFWSGSFDDYLDLYRATSEAAVESGFPLRLGGPTIAYINNTDGGLIDTFLRFVSSDSEIKCDFISLHRKGTFKVNEDPDFSGTIRDVEATAESALNVDLERFKGMPFVNNEADMKVKFDTSFPPRMSEEFPAWLCGMMIASDALSSKFRDSNLRFYAASDNANQQLIQNSFDGRRSIMTKATASNTDLYKVPVYGFYEILRLLGDQHGSFLEGGGLYYPNSELFHASHTKSDNSTLTVGAVQDK